MNIILVIKDNVSINKIACMFFVILSGVGVTILYFNDPRIAKFYPLCIFRIVTGCNCPGCGGLRATYCLLHGDFISALKYNPLLVISLPFIFLLAITKIKDLVRGCLGQSLEFSSPMPYCEISLVGPLLFYRPLLFPINSRKFISSK